MFHQLCNWLVLRGRCIWLGCSIFQEQDNSWGKGSRPSLNTPLKSPSLLLSREIIWDVAVDKRKHVFLDTFYQPALFRSGFSPRKGRKRVSRRFWTRPVTYDLARRARFVRSWSDFFVRIYPANFHTNVILSVPPVVRTNQQPARQLWAWFGWNYYIGS